MFADVETASTAPATPFASVTGVPPRICQKCGTNKKSGKRSCCVRGGAWFGNCGNEGDSQFDHTWQEGIKACERKLIHSGDHIMIASKHYEFICVLHFCLRQYPPDVTATKALSTPKATTALHTSSIAAVTYPCKSICPKCGTNAKSGKLSCCAPEGAWYKNCGNEKGDTRFDHTWQEGIQACARKFVAYAHIRLPCTRIIWFRANVRRCRNSEHCSCHSACVCDRCSVENLPEVRYKQEIWQKQLLFSGRCLV